MKDVTGIVIVFNDEHMKACERAGRRHPHAVNRLRGGAATVGSFRLCGNVFSPGTIAGHPGAEVMDRGS